MGNIFTLDSMREEIEREFAPCVFQLSDGNAVMLQNVLRLPKKTRDAVFALLDELGEIQNDEETTGLASTEKSAQVALKILPLVADSEKFGRQLVESIQEDLALTLRVFSTWMEGSQVGEAEDSQS